MPKEDCLNESIPERRASVWLTERQIDEIAQRAATYALGKVYAEVGKSVVKSVLWVVGAGCLALFAWLAAEGYIKP